MEKTLENLAKAFIGESQARNRYTFYAKQAKKDGYELVSAVFEETATQESEHAKWLMRLINEIKKNNGGEPAEILVEAGVPTVMEDTVENLKAAIAGENYEHTEMYPEFADMAAKEGSDDIAKRLRSIAQAEKHHEDRYKRLLAQIEEGTMFKKSKKIEWVCRKCGYMHTGGNAAEECPSCGHPTAYFQKRNEDY